MKKGQRKETSLLSKSPITHFIKLLIHRINIEDMAYFDIFLKTTSCSLKTAVIVYASFGFQLVALEEETTDWLVSLMGHRYVERFYSSTISLSE